MNKLEVNNADNSHDVSNRALLIATPLEKKEKRISELFQDFTDKMNNHTADITLNDRDDFLKPVYIVNANNEQVPIASEASKISKISLNKDLNKLNHHELAFFTNERRDSPNNSFYEAKKEETEQFVDNVEDDTNQEMPINQNRIHSERRENDEQEYEEDYEEEEEEVAYKEITPSQDAHAKMNLNPPKNDVISDFDELTKNRKIELFKKNTQELEKEEQSKLNENKDIKKNITIREGITKPQDIISHTPKRKIDEISANKLENKSQIEKVSKIVNKLDKEEKDVKKEPTLIKADNKSNKDLISKLSQKNDKQNLIKRNQEIIRLKDTGSKDIENQEIKDKNQENKDVKVVKKEIDEATPVHVNLTKGILIQ